MNGRQPLKSRARASRGSYHSTILRVLGCMAVTVLPGFGFAGAQTPPDAGALLQQIEKEKRNPLPPQSAPQLALPQPLQSFGSAAVTVKAFRFTGNTLLTSKELAASVAGFVN